MLVEMEATPTKISIREMIGSNDRQAAEITPSEEWGSFLYRARCRNGRCGPSNLLDLPCNGIGGVAAGRRRCYLPFSFFLPEIGYVCLMLGNLNFLFAISNCFGRLRSSFSVTIHILYHCLFVRSKAQTLILILTLRSLPLFFLILIT